MAELVCRSSWYEDENARHVLPGARLPASAAEQFSLRSEPFIVAREDYEHLVGSELTDALANAYAVAPITLDSGWAAIAIALDADDDLDERQLELLAGIAGQAKMALTNALSFASLERTFLSTVEALANALEAKDAYTSSHARWITDMALKVGEELGLEPTALKRVELGALFHDIGKIGIPAAILTKPGPLTEEERMLIETHPELGERILAPIEQLEHVRPIVRACHERFDGKGYPDHLEGEEIPLEARIIFVVRRIPRDDDDAPLSRSTPGRGGATAPDRSRRHRSSTRRSSRCACACSRRQTTAQEGDATQEDAATEKRIAASSCAYRLPRCARILKPETCGSPWISPS